MLEQVQQYLPEIYPFVSAGYSIHSNLYFGKHKLLSEEGVHQGDPLGPLLFSLTMHSVLENLNSELKLAYLDEITLGGNLDVLF